jgi:hypothetical protein
MRWRCLLLPLLAAVMAACAPPPTPFPVDIPAAPNATSAPGTIQTPAGLRYALGASATGAPVTAQAEAQALSIEHLDGTPDPAQLGIRYDIAADYGLFTGADAAPGSTTVALVINTTLAPLDDPALAAIVRGAPDPAGALVALGLPGAQLSPSAPAAPLTTAALQAQMANAGWPDGFNLTTAAAPVPGVNALLAPLRALGIELRPLQTTNITPDTWAENRLHLALITWHTPEARQRWAALAGADNVIDLYTLPVGYIALPGLTLTFTPEGWPLPARP